VSSAGSIDSVGGPLTVMLPSTPVVGGVSGRPLLSELSMKQKCSGVVPGA